MREVSHRFHPSEAEKTRLHGAGRLTQIKNDLVDIVRCGLTTDITGEHRLRNNLEFRM